MWTTNFEIFKLDLPILEEPEIKLPTSVGSQKKLENSRKAYVSLTKAFDCVDHNKLWKILKEIGLPDHLTCLLRNLYAGQEATVRTGWNNGLLPNWERSTSRLYIVIQLI